MNHGVGDFNAGRESVEDEPTGLLFENLNQFAIGGEIVFIAKNGRGQMAIEGAGGAQIVLRVVATYEQRVRAEDLICQRRVCRAARRGSRRRAWL